MYFDLVKATSQIERTEPNGPREGVETGLDTGEWVNIFLSERIQFAVVDAETNAPILFRNEHNVRGPFTLAFFDHPLSLHVFEEAVDIGQTRTGLRPQCLFKRYLFRVGQCRYCPGHIRCKRICPRILVNELRQLSFGILGDRGVDIIY